MLTLTGPTLDRILRDFCVNFGFQMQFEEAHRDQLDNLGFAWGYEINFPERGTRIVFVPELKGEAYGRHGEANYVVMRNGRVIAFCQGKIDGEFINQFKDDFGRHLGGYPLSTIV